MSGYRLDCITDHAAVEIKLAILDTMHTPYQWRLNKSLLHDPVILEGGSDQGALLFRFNKLHGRQ